MQRFVLRGGHHDLEGRDRAKVKRSASVPTVSEGAALWMTLNRRLVQEQREIEKAQRVRQPMRLLHRVRGVMASLLS